MGFTLSKLLIEQRQNRLAGADNSRRLFQVRHLSRVGHLIPQHPHMMGQAAHVLVVRPLTLQVEHLRKRQRRQKVVGVVRGTDEEKDRRFPVAKLVQLQLVIGHDLQDLGDVKEGQPGPAAKCSWPSCPK